MRNRKIEPSSRPGSTPPQSPLTRQKGEGEGRGITSAGTNSRPLVAYGANPARLVAILAVTVTGRGKKGERKGSVSIWGGGGGGGGGGLFYT